MTSSEEEAFASTVGSFYEQLVGSRFEDAFGTILVLANMEARLGLKHDNAQAFKEMLLDCESKLGQSLVKALDEIVKSRNSGEKADGKDKQDEEQLKRALARQKQRQNKNNKKPLSTEERRAKLIEQNKKFKLKEQKKIQEKQAQQESELRKQLKREEEDLPRLFRAAELCRIVESLRLVMNKDDVSKADEFSISAIALFSSLVCSGLDERYELIVSDLKSHRALATSTTGVVNQVEAMDDDPYLKALSQILLFADSLIEKLLLGEYAVASADGSQGDAEDASAQRVNQLATSKIVQDVESKTSCTVVFVLDAFYKDKKVDAWVERAKGFLEGEQDLQDEQVFELDVLLNSLMEAQKYCGHFTRFLSSFDVIDPVKIRSGGIASKQLDMVLAYTHLEEAWVTYSLHKAKLCAETSGEAYAQVNSIVENTVFVSQKAFARAVHTESDHACCAAASRICRQLEAEYSQAILDLLQGKQINRSKEGTQGLEDAEADGGGDGGEGDFAAALAEALDSEAKGIGVLKKSTLVAVNTVELSAACLPQLIWEIQYQFEQRFPDKLPMVEMTLEGLQATSDLHAKRRLEALDSLIHVYLKPAMLQFISDRLKKTTYDLTHTLYEQYERDDPFVTKFINQQLLDSKNFVLCQRHLTKSNFSILLSRLTKVIADAWEADVLRYQPRFNELGALRFDQDVRNMQTWLGDCFFSEEEKLEMQQQGGGLDSQDDEDDPDWAYFSQELRGNFARLRQISFLVNLDKVSHVEKIPYSLPVLTADQVRNILARKVQEEPSVDVNQLDVSKISVSADKVDRE